MTMENQAFKDASPIKNWWIFQKKNRDVSFFGVLPRKLTWNLKITCLKRKLIFQTFILGFKMLVFLGVRVPSDKLT